jgi:hypothetical protein
MKTPVYKVAAGLRRLPRPQRVERCAECGAACGGSYATCAACFEAVERHWQADWDARLATENISPGTDEEVLLAECVLVEIEQHPWPVLDFAMTLVVCGECSQELGGGPSDCEACAAAWGNVLWAETLAGQQGLVTANEHALHVGRMVLRHPHRQSQAAVQAWRLSVPRLLTGWNPTTQAAQRMMARIKAGRLDEVEAELRVLDAEIARTLKVHP